MQMNDFDGTHSKSLTILVVSDNNLGLEATCSTILGLGHSPVAVGTVDLALRKFNSDDWIDLILNRESPTL